WSPRRSWSHSGSGRAMTPGSAMPAPGSTASRPTSSASTGGRRAASSVSAQADRDVLLLIAWEQLRYEEVARALGIPVGTVRSRLHRARKKIRKALIGTSAASVYEEILTNE